MTLMETGVRRENRKKYVDTIAAVVYFTGDIWILSDPMQRKTMGISP